MSGYELVAFDFDGTLADTFGCIHAAANAAMERFGLPLVAESALRPLIGLSLTTIFRKITGGVLPEEELDRLRTTYRAIFMELAPTRVTLFPGVPEQLERLRAAGVTLAVATSRVRPVLLPLLDRLAITEYFAVVVAEDMVAGKKPDPEMLHLIRAELDLPLAPAVMVGDAEYDVLMGQAAGMATCAVTWGNGTREQLAALGPTHLVDSAAELAAALRR